MPFLMRIPFIFILMLAPITLVQATEPETLNPVPHNNGTHGLLKNTYIEPLDNFKQTPKPTELKKATDVTTETSTTPIDKETPIKEEQ